MRRGSARVPGGAPGRYANARTTGCGERRAGDAKSKYSDALTGEMAARTIPLYVYLFLTGRTRRGFPFFVLARPSERRKSCRETPVLRRAAIAICAGRPRRDAGKDTTDEHWNADERCVRRRAGDELSRNWRFADKLCSDFAEHESFESSHAETFYLQRDKNRGTRPRFLCSRFATAV